MKNLRTTVLVASIALLAAACSTTPVEEKPAPPPPKVEAPPPVQVDPLDDPKSILATRSVYYEFDRSSLNEHDLGVVEAHARYLVDHSARTVRIEGNCDERGGREYNLALGQRRADAVKDRMKAIGVAASRIETVSLGKEKPKASGHTEAAWAENRRADILYNAK